MSSLEEAQTRVEAALARLETALRLRLAALPGEHEVAELCRRCAALDTEVQKLSCENQRLREALAEIMGRMERAAAMVDALLEGR